MRALWLMLVVSSLHVSPATGWQAAPVPPQPSPALTQDLKRLSLEELAELTVTSVSRRVERLSQAAAAVSVVRYEDIYRMGVASLAEAMRLADGLDVARPDGRGWSISARGFTITTANKLLVLMDGRTLYSPLFAGTFWDVQDAVLSDIDRIEVIRGPGGTVWGANAVNGVINIITKDASDTHGNVGVVAAGSRNDVITAGRHGGRLGRDGSYRVYGKYRRQGANVFASGESAADALRLGHAGFRLDAGAAGQSRWSLQGSVYRGGEDVIDREGNTLYGATLQSRWSRRVAAASNIQLRASYGNTFRRLPQQFEESRHTMDVDAQHQTSIGTRHDLVYGGQLLVTTARDTGGATLFFDPERRTNAIGGAFVQDEIALRPEQLFLTLGSKFEANDYTGLEIQPTARLRWSRRDRQTFWSAVSRAVRLPTRLDVDLGVTQPLTGRLLTMGSRDFRSESVVAYEAGYRVRPHGRLLLDVATFANRYDNLRSQESRPELDGGVVLGNSLNAVTSGIEAAATVQVLSRWRMHGSYSYLHKNLSFDAGSLDQTGGIAEGNDPSYFFTIRSYLDLPRGFSADGYLRRVADRPAPAVPAVSSLSLRLGWAARPGWELSLIGRELLDRRHPEFGAPSPRRYEFERGVTLRSAWSF